MLIVGATLKVYSIDLYSKNNSQDQHQELLNRRYYDALNECIYTRDMDTKALKAGKRSSRLKFVCSLGAHAKVHAALNHENQESELATEAPKELNES